MARYDDLNTSTIAVVGFLAGLLTFVAIIAAQVVYYSFDHSEVQRKQLVGGSASDSALAQQQAQLASYGWTDRERQIVTIPINRAMELIVREMSTTAHRQDGSDVR